MPDRLPTVADRRRTARIDLEREHCDAIRLLGYILLRQNHMRDAIAVFRGLLAINPEDRHAQRSLIYGYLAAGEPERALEIAGSYVPRPRERLGATIHLLRAQALWRLGRADEARAALSRFSELREVD